MAANSIREGHILKEDDIICKRHGTGISPTYWDEVIGVKTKKKIEYDQIINWDNLKNHNQFISKLII